MMQPLSFEYLILISPLTSPETVSLSRISTSPPILLATSRIPVRVLFNPTSLRIISESGTINPAAIKNAADEISPQISICLGCNSDLLIFTQVPTELISAPMYFKRSSV